MDNLFQNMLESLMDGDTISAIYQLRALADELENGESLTEEDIVFILQATLGQEP